MADYCANAFVAVLFIIAVTRAQAAHITLSENTVLGAEPPHGGDTFVVIDGATPPTIVDIIDGANLQGDDEFPIFDLHGSSIVNLLGGFVGFSSKPAFQLNEHSQLIVAGGAFQGACELMDESQMRLIDGDGGRIRTREEAVARFDGGTFDLVDALGQSRIVVQGGFGESFVTQENSRAIIRGGAFSSDVGSTGTSRVLVTGGTFADDFFVQGESVLDWRGGGISDRESLIVQDFGIAHVYGYGLHYEVDEDDGPLIVGKLADGLDLSVRYFIRDQGQIILHEVPEPGTLGLLAVGAGACGVLRWARGRLAVSGLRVELGSSVRRNDKSDEVRRHH